MLNYRVLLTIAFAALLLSGSVASDAPALLSAGLIPDPPTTRPPDQSISTTRTVYTPAQAVELAADWLAFKAPQIPQWQGAQLALPVVYYDLDGAPSAYVFPLWRGEQDAGYLILSYEVQDNPVLEFSANPAPHLRASGGARAAALARGLTLLEARPIFLGPLAYYFEAAPPTPPPDHRRWLAPMGTDQVVEIEYTPRNVQTQDTLAATPMSLDTLMAADGATKFVYGVPNYSQFIGTEYGYSFPCYSGCAPTAATSMAFFWVKAGYPNLDVNPANWRDTTVDIRTRMETFCSGMQGYTWINKASPGLESFAASRGYAFQSLQYCWPNTTNWAGCDHREFSWARYVEQIDQCHPSLISFTSPCFYGPHSIAGVGYDTQGGNYYIIHDGNFPRDPIWVQHQDNTRCSRFLHTFIPPNPLDQTPPSAITLDALPEYIRGDAHLRLSWTAADDAYPGLASYEVQYREGADGVWQWAAGSLTQTSISLERGLLGGQTYYFRVRATDLHCNSTAWSYGSNGVTGDTDPPITAVHPQPRYRTGTSFPVSWSGEDAVSGVAYYIIEVKRDSDSWSGWRSGITITSDIYTGAVAGSTYQFRSRGADRAGLYESKFISDTSVTIAHFSVSGRVLGNRGQPALLAQVSSAPVTYTYNSPATAEPLDGQYTLFFKSDPAAGWVDLTATPASGQDLLPPLKRARQLSGATDISGLDLVLPPPDNAIRNSHFEDELAASWQVSGTLAPTRTQQAHTGDYALLMGALPLSPTQVYTDTIWQWAISQTVTLSPTIHRPTLSWMYRISGTASVSDTFIVDVAGLDAPLSYTVPLTGAGWQHAWLALDEVENLGGASHVTVSFSLRRPAISDTLQVLLDEITLGSGDDGPTHIFLPLIGKNFPRQLISRDAFEPDNAHERICTSMGYLYPETGRVERHNFHLAGDQDWLCIMPERGSYAIETFDLGPRADTVLTIRSYDGTLLQEDDNSGGGLASRIVWKPPQMTPYWYWIGVRHKDSAVYGAGTEYTLSIRWVLDVPTAAADR